MKNLIRISACFVLALSSFIPSQAKSKALTDFVSKVSSSLVSFDYTYSCSMKGKGPKMTGGGDVKVQGSAFHMKGNGLEIWCDGSTIWTVDSFAEEAVIESVANSESIYSTNPALLVSSVDKAFNETSFAAATFAGKSVDASTLVPVQKGKSSSDIALLKLYFKKGTDVLIGAQVKMNDGTVSDFTVTNLKYSAKQNGKELFRCNEKALGSSYVITDLR